MIDTIQNFFRQQLEPSASNDNDIAHRAKLAAAALLIETMRADFAIGEEETDRLVESLQSSFDLNEVETHELIELAHDRVDAATCLHEFTSLLNEHWSFAQKVEIIENMWHIAYADGEADAHEQHLIRKVASLLYISPKENAAAKTRAKSSSQH